MTNTVQGFTRWRLRLKAGAANAANSELDGAVEWLEGCEYVCGLIVFFGIALEVAIAFLNPPYGAAGERWGLVFADGFVALGVLGELVASGRIRVCQGELTRRSNELLSDAVKEAGEANARAVEAQLEVEHLKKEVGWRDVSVEQATMLKALLKVRDAKLTVSWSAGDAEGSYFAHKLATALQQCGLVFVAGAPISFLGEEKYGITMAGWRRDEVNLISDAVEGAGIGTVQRILYERPATPEIGGEYSLLLVGYRVTPTI